MTATARNDRAGSRKSSAQLLQLLVAAAASYASAANAAAAPALAASLACDAGGPAYGVTLGGAPLFSSPPPLAVFENGGWTTAWARVGARVADAGSDALGAFERATCTYARAGDASGAPAVVLSVATYAAPPAAPGLSIVRFAYAFPGGLAGTAHNASASGGGGASYSTISNFPAFGGPSGPLPHVLTWSGSFAQPSNDIKDALGMTGGPVVFYGADVSGAAAVLSPLDRFLTASLADDMGGGLGRCASAPGGAGCFAAGVSATVTAVPPGFAQSWVLAAGGAGVQATVAGWGAALRAYYGDTATKLADVSLTRLSYQTDNGAQLCFGCPGQVLDKCMIEEKQYLDSIGVGQKLGMLSFQNAWWRSGGESAPWCVGEWTPVPAKVPGGIKAMQEALGLPLQLYAPYFCATSAYPSNFTMVRSDTSLPGCSSFDFFDPAPSDSIRFYEFLLGLGQDYGMTLFEPDFLNQNHKCVRSVAAAASPARTRPPRGRPLVLARRRAGPHTPAVNGQPVCARPGRTRPPTTRRRKRSSLCVRVRAYPRPPARPPPSSPPLPPRSCVPLFIETIGAAEEFFAGQATVALNKGIPIQWCFVTPYLLMWTLTAPAITNFRGSYDYAYGESYDVGRSSLLIAAMGGAPSKDTFWTSDNGNQSTARGACDKTGCPPDHSAAGAWLHTIVALLTTGPVGFSDAPGWTDAGLLGRTADAAGFLLQPSRPVTAVDSTHDVAPGAAPAGGFVLGTHCAVGGAVWLHEFVSHSLTSPFTLRARDFFPALPAASTWARFEWNATRACAPGSPAAACGVAVVTAPADPSAGPALATLPAAPAAGGPGAAFQPTLTLFAPDACSGGAILLGEVDKYVPVSPMRFAAVACAPGGDLAVTLTGVRGESARVGVLTASRAVQFGTVAFPAGDARFAVACNVSAATGAFACAPAVAVAGAS